MAWLLKLPIRRQLFLIVLIVTLPTMGALIFALVEQPIIRNLSILLLLILLASQLAFILVRRCIVRPLEVLEKALVEFGHGKLEIKVADLVADGEIRELARAFDDMAQKLSESYRERDKKEKQLLEQNSLLFKMADSLKESEERYRTLFEQSPDGIVLIDPHSFQVLDFNEAAHRRLGYSRDEFARLKVQDFEMIDDLEAIVERGRQIREQGTVLFESIHKARSGELENVEVHLKTVNIGGRQMNRAIFHDITEKKLAEEALRTSEMKFRTFVESSFDVIFALDANGVFQFVSPSWEKHFGFPPEEVIGRDFRPFVHPDDALLCAEYLTRVLTTGQGDTSPEYRVRHADGTWRHFLANGNCYRDAVNSLFYIGVGHDITKEKLASEERIALERQFLHSQKLESLGIMAGGIAHDFNNILAAVMGNLELTMRRLPPSAPAFPTIEKAMKSCQRATSLTRQMLAFTGKGVFLIRQVDLGCLVDENIDLFRSIISKSIELTIETCRDLPPVDADPGQMGQVIMNLITNAAEAIDGTPGMITLKTGHRFCDKDFLQQSRLSELPPAGDFVFMEVSDTGCGMDGATMLRLFEPFFTTKFTGRGLGMSAVLGIIKAHKGAIMVESKPGKGSIFKILLPVSEQTYPLKTPDQPSLETGELSDGMTGKVLVVDDDPSVSEICVEYLRDFGFSVVAAASGMEAVAVYRNNPDDIALVILDLTMPVMDGAATFRELKRISTDARVIISSGHITEEVSMYFPDEKPEGFIQKPFRMAALRECISQVKECRLIRGRQVT